MFNLVRKRYLFLLISLAVIVPGTISLLVPGLGLNVGIDFAGGATIHLRPSSFVSITQARNLLKPLNLTELQVITGDNTSLPGKQTVWVRLNVRIDTFVQNTIKSALQTKYGSQLEEERRSRSLPLPSSRQTTYPRSAIFRVCSKRYPIRQMSRRQPRQPSHRPRPQRLRPRLGKARLLLPGRL